MKHSIYNVLIGLTIPFTFVSYITAQTKTPLSQMEKLTRGVVSMHKPTGGNYVSWRLLGTESTDVIFDVMRDGKVISSSQPLTNFEDVSGTTSSTYQIVAKINGETIEKSVPTHTWENVYKRVKLQRPVGGSFTLKAKDGKDSIAHYSYYPHDCSAADLDGDGEYEIVVKWNPTNAQDNAVNGYTGACILDAYKIDFNKVEDVVAKRLWRVDLGKNIRSGSHYTQFLVYDFDGDGKAEMICKTAPGSVDGKGQYVSNAADDAIILATDNNKDYRTSAGRIMSGPEFLTVFNGETGAAINTIWYNPNRAGESSGEAIYPKDFWGDDYGNRGERYLATVAYLDGQDKNPSAVMCRGYYTYAYMWAVDFDGQKLKTKWLHASESANKVVVTDANGNKTTKTYNSNTGNSGKSCTLYANGNHNLSCADVDGDGKDEIIYGSAAVDDDGSLLYAVGWGHGDAMHLSKLMPDRPGLQVFTVHEESPYGWDIHDAATGEVIYYETGSNDNGRGLAADILPDRRGFEFWSANDRTPRSAVNGQYLSGVSTPSMNFRCYWGGNLKDDLLDGTNLMNYDRKSYTLSMGANVLSFGHSASCNSIKSTPCLVADLYGDWREEIVLWNSQDSCTLNIFSSSESTKYRVPTLMHDHTYRLGIAWQNAAYNQPPHLGFYLPDYVAQATAIKTVTADREDWITLESGHRVRIDVASGETVNLAVFDLGGRLCWQKRVEGSQLVQLPDLPRGTYMLKAKSNENVYVRKFLTE